MNHSPVIVWTHLNPGLIEGYIDGIHLFNVTITRVTMGLLYSEWFFLTDLAGRELFKTRLSLDDCFRKAHQLL